MFLNLPATLAGHSITCWSRMGKDGSTTTIDIVLLDGERAVLDMGADGIVEWECRAVGYQGGAVETQTTPENSRKFDLWHRVIKLEEMEQEGRLFRGEDSIYPGPILSRMRRYWRWRGLSGDDLLDLEKMVIQEARRYSSTEEEDRLIADCQHIGVPMNVIDFTTCMKVALWFACLPSPTASGGRVRVVEEANIHGRLLEPNQQNDRIRSQKGVLVHIATGTMEDDEISESVPFREDDKAPIREILQEHYGIDRTSLFPDFSMFQEDIENGRVRFLFHEERAGVQAQKRGDSKLAKRIFEDVVSYRTNHDPSRDGGFNNIHPLRNLSITMASLGEWENAIRTGERALAIARNASNSEQILITEQVLATISRIQRHRRTGSKS